METKDVRDLVRFSEGGPHHATLYEADHVWSEVVCLQGGQRIGPIGDPASDAIVTILAGEVSVQVDRSRKRCAQWDAVLVPAGSQLSLANASEEPSVTLVVAAPPPPVRRLSG